MLPDGSSDAGGYGSAQSVCEPSATAGGRRWRRRHTPARPALVRLRRHSRARPGLLRQRQRHTPARPSSGPTAAAHARSAGSGPTAAAPARSAEAAGSGRRRHPQVRPGLLPAALAAASAHAGSAGSAPTAAGPAGSAGSAPPAPSTPARSAGSAPTASSAPQVRPGLLRLRWHPRVRPGLLRLHRRHPRVRPGLLRQRRRRPRTSVAASRWASSGSIATVGARKAADGKPVPPPPTPRAWRHARSRCASAGGSPRWESSAAHGRRHRWATARAPRAARARARARHASIAAARPGSRGPTAPAAARASPSAAKAAQAPGRITGSSCEGARGARGPLLADAAHELDEPADDAALVRRGHRAAREPVTQKAAAVALGELRGLHHADLGEQRHLGHVPEPRLAERQLVVADAEQRLIGDRVVVGVDRGERRRTLVIERCERLCPVRERCRGWSRIKKASTSGGNAMALHDGPTHCSTEDATAPLHKLPYS